MGDFNSEPMEETMSDFMELYDLKKLVRMPIIISFLSSFFCKNFTLFFILVM